MVDLLIQSAVEMERNGCLLEAYDRYMKIVELLEKSRDPYDKQQYDYCCIHAKKISVHICAKIRHGHGMGYVSLDLGDTNVDYNWIYGRCFNANTKEFLITQPNLSTDIELEHFITFIETALNHCPNLDYITLKTNPATSPLSKQSEILKTLKEELRDYKIRFSYSSLDEINMAIILMNDGTIIESTLGLHFYEDDHLFQQDNEIARGDHNNAYADYKNRKCKGCLIRYFQCGELSDPVD